MEMSRKGVVVVVGCSQDGGIIMEVKAIFWFLTADPAAAAAAAHTH